MDGGEDEDVCDLADISCPSGLEVDMSLGSSNDSLDTNVSRLITEEDLIDSLFYACDVQRDGQVHVSRLIEYIRFTAGSPIEV